MSGLRKTALLLVTVLLLLAVSGYLFLESSAPSQWARQQLISYLQSRFFVRVEVGALNLNLFGNRVILHDLRLFSTAHQSLDPAFSVRRLDLNFSITSFIRRSISLDRLVMEAPSFRFFKDPDGRSNWANMFRSRQPRAPDSQPERFWWSRVRIETIELTEGVIWYEDRPFSIDSGGANLEVMLSWETARRGYSASFGLRQFELAINGVSIPQADLTGSLELTSEGIAIHNVQLDSEAVRASFSGQIRDLNPFTYQVEVEELEANLPAFSRAGFLSGFESGSMHVTGTASSGSEGPRFLGQGISQDIRFRGFGFSEVKLDFVVDREGVAVDSSSFRFLGGLTRAQGHLAWREQRSSHFRLVSGGVDIERFLEQVNYQPFPLEGTADFEGEVRWPGLRIQDREGRGHITYRGALGSTPAPHFDGMAGLTFRGNEIVLNDGQFVANEVDLNFDGRVVPGQSYYLTLAVNSQVGDRARHLLAATALVQEPDMVRNLLEFPGPLLFSGSLLQDEGFLLEGELSSQGVRWGEHSLGQLDTSLRVVDRSLQLQQAKLIHPEFNLSGSLTWVPQSTLSSRQRLDLQLAWERVPLDRVLLLAPSLNFEAAGTTSGELELVQEDTAAFLGRGQLILEKLRLGPEMIPKVQSEIIFEQDRVRFLPQISAFGGRLSGDLSYDLQEGLLETTLRGSSLELGAVACLNQAVSWRGPVQLQLSADGTLTNLQGRMSLQAPSVFLDEYDLQDVHLSARLQNRVVLFDLQQRFQDHPFLLRGSVANREGFPLTLETQVEFLPLQPYLRLMLGNRLPQLEGSVSGQIQLQGLLTRWDQLQASIDLAGLQLAVGGKELQLENPVKMVVEQGQIRFPEIALIGSDTTLRVEGSAQIGDDKALNLRVWGDADLEVLAGLFPGASLAGHVLLERIDIVGPALAPRLVGQAVIEDGEMTHPGLPIRIYNAQGALRFTADQISLDSFRADSELGHFNATGGVFLEGFSPQRWQINVFGNGLRFQYPQDFNSVADVDVNLFRNRSSHLISGVVYVRSAEHTQELSLPQLILDYTRSQSVPPSVQAAAEETVLDIRIEAYRSISIDNNLANITASGDLTLRGTLHSPVIVGSMTVDEGQLFLENNEYVISRGSINFNDPRRTRPVFNFEASTEIREFSISVSVRGPPDQLKMSFRSDPPLPTASVVSLLATGQTQDEIFGPRGAGPTGTLAIYGAGSILSKTLGERVESSTSRLFGFDRFSIDPFIDSGARDPGARVTLGKQLTRELGVNYITNLGGQALRQSVVVQYRITDWLTAVGTGQEDGTLAIDFKIRKRF